MFYFFVVDSLVQYFQFFYDGHLLGGPGVHDPDEDT